MGIIWNDECLNIRWFLNFNWLKMVDKSDTISQPVITHSVRSHIVLVSMGERVAPFILRLLKCLYSSGVQDLTVRLFSAKSQTSQLISTLRKRVELLSSSIIQQSRNQVPQPLARYPWCKPGLHQEDTSSLQTQNHPHTQYFSVSLTMPSGSKRSNTLTCCSITVEKLLVVSF